MLPYRRQFRTLKVEATVQEKRLRQLSLLERSSNTKIPEEVEATVLELLVQMLILVIPVFERGEVDEQNQK